MTWRNKLEQLVGLLEKVPQPKSFDSKVGVYQPYFIIELRAGNWEIIPYATYTRLDNSPGREVRLSMGVIDTSKVDITRDELDCLLFLEAGSGHNSHSIFSYTQPVGFLLDWLTNSHVVVKETAHKAPTKVKIVPEMTRIIIGLKRGRSGYYLLPKILFPDGKSIAIENQALILCSNPIHMLYDDKIYKIESALPAVFWSNYFRIREKFEIPTAELSEFIRLYLPHIVPVLDWDNLGDKIDKTALKLGDRKIYFSEWNNHLQIDVKFSYGKYELPAYPITDRSLANEGKKLFVINRNTKEEDRCRSILEENGLIFRNGNWHIAADYNNLDWMREIVPRLEKAGFVLENEEQLTRFRVHRQKPKLQIKVRSRTDWLDLSYFFMLGKTPIEIPDVLRQMQSSKGYLRLADGSNIHLADELRERIEQLARYLDLRNGQGEVQLPLAGITLLGELEAAVENLRLDKKSRLLLEKYQQFNRIEAIDPPKSLNGTLREYQRHGLNWLNFLVSFGFGGILADDMGLGKTIQIISLLLKQKENKSSNKPALIVVPLTLIFNWWEEFRKFAPEVKVLRYYGSRAERAKMLKNFASYDVILCSYGVILQDQKSLTAKRFNFLILDESQKIKNPGTKTYKAVQKLDAANKLALTGTPIENSLTDLWAQINFVNPGLLGTLKQFEKKYVDVEEPERATQITVLKQLIFPFILRRTKEEVEKELPPLTEITQYVEMTDKQRENYDKSLQFYRNQVFEELESAGLNKTRIKIVEALTYLRQITCHPGILDKDFELHDAGKIQLLEHMLADLVAKGHKILIFSQFVRFLRLVRQLFDANRWKYEYLDGKVKNRAARIHNFQENPKVSAFLISLKAGGLGLNLTAADYVIHLDPWWNPAVEQQATDRAHRIGQSKNVFVYKYVMRNSIEEKILQLQQTKRELSDELISSDAGFVKNLSRDDLELLFRIDQQAK